jgi:hypothetical protein
LGAERERERLRREPLGAERETEERAVGSRERGETEERAVGSRESVGLFHSPIALFHSPIALLHSPVGRNG